MKILYTTNELLCPDLVLRLKLEGNEVDVAQKEANLTILKGTLHRIPYETRLKNLKDYDLVIEDDNSGDGDAVKARELGIPAIGGDKKTHKMEMDRKFASNVAKACELLVPEVIEVKDLEDAKKIIKEKGGKFVLKQQGVLDILKGLNYVAKLDNSEDLIAHIENLQEKWTEGVEQDFVLQEKIEGYEFACSAWWNGKDWMRDKDGSVAVDENFEHKSLFPGNLGQSTGEQFTVLRYVKGQYSKLFLETIDKLKPALEQLNFRGDFDINSIVTEKGAYFLEFTPRMGVPALSGMIEIHKSKWGQFLLACAKGEQMKFEYDPRWCVVSWLYTSPFPFVNPKKKPTESNKKITNIEKIYELMTPRLADSMGVKVLFKPDMTKDDLKHIHYDGVMYDKGALRVANHDGYVATVSEQGSTVKEAGEKVEKILRKIILPKAFWRNDFHDTNYHKAKEDLEKWGYLFSTEEMAKKDYEEKQNNKKEEKRKKVRQSLRDILL
jgi:phosphoribosylamine---glycine ligase